LQQRVDQITGVGAEQLDPAIAAGPGQERVEIDQAELAQPADQSIVAAVAAAVARHGRAASARLRSPS
jgi:hypothetical protein